MTRARTDSNQKVIVAAFRQLGFTVKTTHEIGQGFPDLVVAKNGVNILIEIKDGSKPPSRRKLTPDEREFHDTWRGRIEIVQSVDDVIQINNSIK